MTIHGIVFDLDGTLVDSGLDFAAIRRDLRLPAGRPILEALDEMPEGDWKAECRAMLRTHELAGADRATFMPGAVEVLESLTQQNRRLAILTRNSREATARVLDRLKLSFSVVVTREDVPPKPDPEGLLKICRHWGVAADEICFVGDFLFDLQTGQRAGVPTILYMPDGVPEFADQADFQIRHFSELLPLISRLE